MENVLEMYAAVGPTFTTPSEAFDFYILPALGDDFTPEFWDYDRLEEALIEKKDHGQYGLASVSSEDFESLLQANER